MLAPRGRAASDNRGNLMDWIYPGSGSARKVRGPVQGNLTVCGRRTSIRLEPELWEALHDIAAREGTSVHALATLVASSKPTPASLTSAIRVQVLSYYRRLVT